MKLRNLWYRVVVNVEKLEEGAFWRRQLGQSAAQEVGPASPVEIQLEFGFVREKALIDVFQVFGQPPAPPVIADRVADDLHEQCAWMGDGIETMKSFQCVERHVLFQVFVVKRSSGSPGCDANQSADVGKIKIHVTFLRGARLYLA